MIGRRRRYREVGVTGQLGHLIRFVEHDRPGILVEALRPVKAGVRHPRADLAQVVRDVAAAHDQEAVAPQGRESRTKLKVIVPGLGGRHASVNRFRSKVFIGLPCPMKTAGISCSFTPDLLHFRYADQRPALSVKATVTVSPTVAQMTNAPYHAGNANLAGVVEPAVWNSETILTWSTYRDVRSPSCCSRNRIWVMPSDSRGARDSTPARSRRPPKPSTIVDQVPAIDAMRSLSRVLACR